MPVSLTPADFAAWGITEQEKLVVLIADALASAAIVAPCLSEPEFPYADAAKAILREAVLRRLEAGTGAVTTHQTSAGPFAEALTTDNRLRRTILQPSDITELQRLCTLFAGDQEPRAGAILMVGSTAAPLPAHPFVTDTDRWR